MKKQYLSFLLVLTIIATSCLLPTFAVHADNEEVLLDINFDDKYPEYENETNKSWGGQYSKNLVHTEQTGDSDGMFGLTGAGTSGNVWHIGYFPFSKSVSSGKLSVSYDFCKIGKDNQTFSLWLGTDKSYTLDYLFWDGPVVRMFSSTSNVASINRTSWFTVLTELDIDSGTAVQKITNKATGAVIKENITSTFAAGTEFKGFAWRENQGMGLDNIKVTHSVPKPCVTEESIKFYKGTTEEKDITCISTRTNKITIDFTTAIKDEFLGDDMIFISEKSDPENKIELNEPIFEDGKYTFEILSSFEAETEYVLAVSGDVEAKSGQTLGEDFEIEFKTDSGQGVSNETELFICDFDDNYPAYENEENKSWGGQYSKNLVHTEQMGNSDGMFGLTGAGTSGNVWHLGYMPFSNSVSSGTIIVKYDFCKIGEDNQTFGLWTGTDQSITLDYLFWEGPVVRMFSSTSDTVKINQEDWFTVETEINLDSGKATQKITNKTTGDVLKENIEHTFSAGITVSGFSWRENGGIGLDNIQVIHRIYDPQIDNDGVEIFYGEEEQEDLLNVATFANKFVVDFHSVMDEESLDSDNVYIYEKNATENKVLFKTPIYKNGKYEFEVESTLKEKTDYVMYISGMSKSNKGVILGNDFELAFRTEDGVQEVTGINLKQNGSVVESLEQFKSELPSTLELEFLNSSETPINLNALLCGYYEDDKMAFMIPKPIQLAGYSSGKYTVDFETNETNGLNGIEVIILEQGNEIKEFVHGISIVESKTAIEYTDMQTFGFEAKCNFGLSNVALNGKGNENERFLFVVFPKDKSALNEIAYIGTETSDSEGLVAKTIGLENSDSYDIYVISKTNKYELPIEFTNDDDYVLALSEIATDESGSVRTKESFINYATTNISKLGWNTEISNDVELSKVLGMLYDELGIGTAEYTPLDPANFDENVELFSLYAYINLLNDGSNANIAQYVPEIVKIDKEFESDFNNQVNNSSSIKYFVSKAIKKAYTSKADLLTGLKKALVLTTVRFSDGQGTVKDVFGKYKDIIGIQSVTSNNNVYRELSGKDFDTVENLAYEYTQLVNRGGSGGSSGGGSSSGGASGSANRGSSFTVSAPAINASTNINNDVIGMNFIDLDTVPWAYEPISTLYDAGIINGYSQDKFAPNALIKREEFVKLLVGVFGEQEFQAEDAGYSDVRVDDWFYSSVNIASKKGYISGIGNAMFGSGNNITRQDMVSMVYRALKINGYDTEYQELSFTDKDSISEYAVEAIGAMVKAGVINGKNDNHFDPLGSATRAEAAKVLFGVYTMLK